MQFEGVCRQAQPIAKEETDKVIVATRREPSDEVHLTMFNSFNNKYPRLK